MNTLLDRIRRQAEQRGVALYAVGLFREEDPSRAQQARHDLDRLTESTGGLAYYPSTVDDIDRIERNLAREIRQQYAIGFAR